MVSIKKKAIQFLKFILYPEVFKCQSSSQLSSIALGWENISIYAETVLSLVEC